MIIIGIHKKTFESIIRFGFRLKEYMVAEIIGENDSKSALQ